MPTSLQTLIPTIDEEGRAKRVRVEHRILDRLLKDLDDPELDHAEFRHLMHDYCELKKQDNIKEKNAVLLAIADARLCRGSRLRAPQDLSFGASSNSGFTTGYADESPTVLTNSATPTDDTESNPDTDPEWSLAPWGRRRNGRPRTEKEFRTILNRAVRAIYGLDFRESGDCRKPDPEPIPTHADSDQPHAPAKIESIAHNSPPHHDHVDPLPGPSPPEQHDPADDTDDPQEESRKIPSFPVGPVPRHPPNSREVSPFCRPDAPFLPKPTNPWCSNEW